MMNGVGWAMGGGGWLWMVIEIAVAIAVIVALVWLVVAALPGRQRSTTDDAAKILAERFARGDFADSEFEQARRRLDLI